MVSNVGSSISSSASDNTATSYDGSTSDDRTATINSATITVASAIFVGRIARAAIVPTAAYNCPSSNHRSAAIDSGSPVNCGSPVN
jgi:hypothetical protein